MKSKNENSILNLVVISAVVNTLVITPFFNKDGMIIPKLFVMFTTAMFILPVLLKNFKKLLEDRLIKLTAFIHIVLILHIIIVIFVSSAPIEQQIFGRTGRGLGAITILTLSIIFIITSIAITVEKLRFLLLSFILSSSISSFYALLQSYGLDLISWETRTNGVIGTLGNPNFQSAFAAMALIPSFLYFLNIKNRLYFSFLSFMFFSFVIYRTQSTQGIIAGLGSIIILFLIYFWYKSKRLFLLTLFGGVLSGAFAIRGMLGHGPLSAYLYKVSIQSRGDFWRSAFTTANNHPFYGVGIDSFGDYSLKYRDEIAASHPWAEYTDNAHNFFLHQASTGGYPYAILNLFLIILVIYAFFKIQKIIKKFDLNIASLFILWSAFQMISVISPENLVNIYWNAIISGALIGVSRCYSLSVVQSKDSKPSTLNTSIGYSWIFGVFGFLILLPLFNVDRQQLIGMKTGNADLVMKATYSFPESTVRYNLIGRELFDSGLVQQSLEVARSGVKFNPNSPALWALILVNPNAPIEERIEAKKKIIEFDPLNSNVKSYIPE